MNDKPSYIRNIKLSIIIVNYNTKDYTLKCLGSIYSTYKNADFEIFIVDNNSSDGSIEAINKMYPKINIIKNTVNEGFAKANNQAIKICSGEYIMLLNPDTEIINNSIDLMVKFLDNNKEVGIVAPQLLNTDGTLQPSGDCFTSVFHEILWSSLLYKLLRLSPKDRFFNKNRNYNETLEIRDFSGACLMIRKQLIDQIGLLDEKFFLGYEDIDFCLRTHKAGWKIFYYPKAKIIHHWGKSCKSPPPDLIIKFLKGKFYFYRKNYGMLSSLIIRLISGINAISKIPVFIILSFFKKKQQPESLKLLFKIISISFFNFKI